MTYILCTDLDRTLIPNGPQLQDPDAIKLLHTLHNDGHLKLIYVSGRDKGLIKQAIEEHKLPIPDFAIADVGARIYKVTETKWQKDNDWKKYLASRWDDDNFDELGRRLAELEFLQEQETERQSRFKHSFYLDAELLESDLDQTVLSISKEIGISIRMIKSLDETTNTGLLDILPEAASKYHAIRFLMDKYGFELDNIVFSGDSGNDMEVLTSEIPAILVNNAIPAIKQQAIELAKKHGHADHLYIAEGEFYGLNGNYCSGILEGVAYYFPVFRKLIAEHRTS